MTASELLADLRTKDVRLSVPEPDRLHVNAPESLVTPEFLETLRARKADIIAELRRHDEDGERDAFYRELGRDPDVWREFQYQREERAAILEFDGGLSRDEATALAEVMTADQWLN
jgi:TubC N-terminal docking domain